MKCKSNCGRIVTPGNGTGHCCNHCGRGWGHTIWCDRREEGRPSTTGPGNGHGSGHICSIDCPPVAIGLPGGHPHVSHDKRFLDVHDHDPEQQPRGAGAETWAERLERKDEEAAHARLPDRRYAVVVYEITGTQPEYGRLEYPNAQERVTHILSAKTPWDALLAAAEPVQQELDGE